MTAATAERTNVPVNEVGNEAPLARRVQYVPDAPIGSAGTLKQLLEQSSASIAMALPKHVTPERLIKTMLVAVNRVPELLRCTQSSVLETINRAAELGLDLSGTLGEAYPVPFSGKCQLIIGYRGLAKLARQSGEVKRIEAEVVCANDRFVYRKGLNGVLEFEPNITGDRGAVLGAYALVEFKDGGAQYDFMPKADIEKVRSKAMSKNSPAWKDHWDEMAKKTVFRRVAKWLPLSAEKFVAAIEHSNATDGQIDFTNVVAAETGAAGLQRQLSGGESPIDTTATEVIDSQTGEVVAEAKTEAADATKPTAPVFEGKGAKDAQEAWDSLIAEAHRATELENAELIGVVHRFIGQVSTDRPKGAYTASELMNSAIRKFIIEQASKFTPEQWKAL